MIKLVAVGTMSTLAWRFWMVSLTSTRMPFHDRVAFTMSSPIFFGESPSGPTFGASTDDGAGSPATWRTKTYFTSFGSNLGAIAEAPSLEPKWLRTPIFFG